MEAGVGRPLRRLIEGEVEAAIAERVLQGHEGKMIVNVCDGRIVVGPAEPIPESIDVEAEDAEARYPSGSR